ncbi:M48 family metallopeptidase [Bifidobacterium boum]
MSTRRRASRRAASTTTMRIGGMTVTVIRKPIRNMYLRVQPPNGTIQVTAPMRIPTERIETFVGERVAWIHAQQRTIQRMQHDTMRLMREMSGNGQSDRRKSGVDTANPSHSATGVAGWTDDMRQQAKQSLERQLPALLDHWTRIIGRSPTRITFRIMHSRWGSCTPATGRIRLNLQLGLMEPRFLEYVLVHELTHLWAGGHGSRFQQLMDRFLPGWRDLRRELNRYAVL